jgi:hypothetical protein
MTPSVTESLPTEAIEVVAGTVLGPKPAYYMSGLWWEPVDGPDHLLVDAVLSWEPKT